MGRSLKYEIPGEDPRVPISDFAEKGWTALFGRGDPPGTRRERVLEVGFGRGEFLLGLSERSPETDFVGIEISFKRTLKMARKVARAELTNVRLVEAKAEHAISTVFDRASLDAIWVNFSDPWPKARHGHRRVIQPAFIRDATAALLPGGRLYVATDDVPYAHQIGEVLAAEPRLENEYAPLPFLPEVGDRMQTSYEEQWRAAGRPLHFFAHRKKNNDGDSVSGGRS